MERNRMWEAFSRTGLAGMFLALALLAGCGGGEAERREEEKKRALRLEQEAREAAERLAAEQATRRRVEQEYADLKEEKRRANHIAKAEREGDRGILLVVGVLAASAVLALTLSIFLLARARRGLQALRAGIARLLHASRSREGR